MMRTLRTATLTLLIVRDFLPAFCQSTRMSLQDALLTNYSTFGAGALPVADPSAAINLLFGVAIHQILELRGSEQTLVTRLWLRMSWHDDFLQWNPANHGGIETLALPVKNVWTPDIFLYNNVHGEAGGLKKVADVVLDSDGNATWLQPGIFRSACSMDISLFPFDEQTCELHFGSWVHPTSRIDITPGEIDTSEYQENEQFLLAKSEIHREVRSYGGNATYAKVKVRLQLKRRCNYYKFNMIQPWVILMVLNIAAFYIPADCGERLGFTITILLSLVLFQEVVAQQLPHTSTTTPLLSRFFAMTTGLVSLTILATILVTRLSYCTLPSRLLSPRIRRALLDKVAPRLGMGVSKPRKKLCVSFSDPRNETFIKHDALISRSNSVCEVTTDHLVKDIAKFCRGFTLYLKAKHDAEDELEECKMAALVLDRIFLIIVATLSAAQCFYFLAMEPDNC
ncbi:neuronal acetylcholine receptor subunit alpha-10-like [Branchiostoma lanceolatum]|uniref:neuronal acetylcholine receptor subunit alpha-10-like n=1 Tax=Branchiostoma lanceolatum TaxID=7740 RepID=UPI0034537CD3